MVRSLRSLEHAELINTGERERVFTERLARQHDLLKRLRGATEKPNLTQLAADYKVDRRTIRRDLHDLVQRGQLLPLMLEGEPE
jgi:predicted DNA-binding transcriptional regulator YafY